MYKMEFYDKNTIQNVDINYPDIYFTPEYGIACEYSDNAIWELCKYKDLIYVYLKRPVEYEGITYYDLITPYGYSGYYYENEETYLEFIPIFREKGKKRKYITEVLRQNPYLNINITRYDIMTSKTIYGIEIDNFDNYFKNILNGNKRNMFRKASKNNLKFEFISIENSILQDKFVKLYNLNMNKLNASKYYYFNDGYFKSLENIKNNYLILIKNKDNDIIGSSIIFIYNDIIHYHLSCNDKSINCITDFLLITTLKIIGINKLFILGGGLKDGDNLSKFKKKLSNKEFQYTIYKNILNQEIYDKLSVNNENNSYFPCYR
jgi:serine/alanine adding enzyme